MGSRLKEEEKNEKAIRTLLRKPTNRRCINCNSVGPQYVCLNFWTFVCTQCSGIHREFTHRVKSVSMSKFTSQEVTNLENGGNERAREIYFKDWDPQRQPLPDSSNVDRLRDFIKSVYMEKRFSGEKPLPRGRGGDREETFEGRRPEPRSNYGTSSRSPPYEDRYGDQQGGHRSNAGYEDRRYSDHQGGHRSNVGYEDRRYEERGGRYDERRSPGRFETDRNRYERSYNDNRRSEDRYRYENRDRHNEDRYNEGLDRRFEERFASEKRNLQRNQDYGSNSPPIRPVKEILGEDVPPLRVEDHGSHTNGGRDVDRFQRSQDGRGQRFGSSSSFGSIDGNVPVAAPVVAPVIKRENSGSLIDFLAEPEVPVAREQSDPFGITAAVQPVASTSSSTGWATFDMFSTATAAGSAAPLPSSSPSPSSAASAPASGSAGGFKNLPTQTNGGALWATQWPAMQSAPVSHSLESSADSWSSLVGPVSQPSVSSVTSQAWSPFSTTPVAVPTQSLPAGQLETVQDTQSANSSAVSVTQMAPVPPTSRHAIPEDFFMGSQTGLQFSGGPSFTPQYMSSGGVGMPVQVGNYSQPQKSINPFDLPGDSSFGSATGEFPNVSPLKAALPSLNMGPMSVPGSGLGAFIPQWRQTNMMPTLPPSYPPAAPSGGYFVGPSSSSAMSQTMQPRPVGFMGGGMPGGFLSAPNQSAESPFLIQGGPQLSSQNSFGMGPELSYTVQGGGPQMPFQNPLGPAGGPAVSSDPFMLGQTGQRLIPQSSLGSLSSMPSTESYFRAQAPSQLHTQSSLGSLGNPFG